MFDNGEILCAYWIFSLKDQVHVCHALCVLNWKVPRGRSRSLREWVSRLSSTELSRVKKRKDLEFNYVAEGRRLMLLEVRLAGYWLRKPNKN